MISHPFNINGQIRYFLAGVSQTEWWKKKKKPLVINENGKCRARRINRSSYNQCKLNSPELMSDAILTRSRGLFPSHQSGSGWYLCIYCRDELIKVHVVNRLVYKVSWLFKVSWIQHCSGDRRINSYWVHVNWLLGCWRAMTIKIIHLISGFSPLLTSAGLDIFQEIPIITLYTFVQYFHSL